MPLAESITSNIYTINAYEDNSISVSEKEYTHSFILSPSHLIEWPISDINEICIEHCEKLLEFKPQVVLLGTGAKQLFPKPEIYAFFGQHQIGLEVMANHAACRTFNILAAEDRDVVCGFILTPEHD